MAGRKIEGRRACLEDDELMRRKENSVSSSRQTGRADSERGLQSRPWQSSPRPSHSQVGGLPALMPSQVCTQCQRSIVFFVNAEDFER